MSARLHLKARATTLFGAIVLATAVTVAASSTASAVSYAVYHATDEISARLTPTAAPTNLVGPHKGNAINVQCQVIGQPVGPHGNTLYFQTTWPGIGTIYVPDTWTDSPHLAGQPPISGIPMCGAAPAPPLSSGTRLSRSSAIGFCVNTGLQGCRPSGTPVIPANVHVDMVCYADGSWANVDYNTNRWFWVKYTGTNVEGFVTASLVKSQTGVPSCAGNPSVVVVQQAASRVGQVIASATDTSAFPASEWKPGPLGEWSGDCPKLVSVSWRAAGVSTRRQNAIQNWRAYQNAGLARGGTPAVGATVFFNLSSYGHEAIYLGSGWIATTNGLDGAHAANTAVPMSSKPNYLGWVWGF